VLKKILVLLAIVVGVLAGLIVYLNICARSLPDNNPAAFTVLNAGKSPGKVVVCLGDSITHGSVSCNYVDELSRRLSAKGFIFVNAGINGELAFNALLRVKEVAACDPDYVTVLIGTNDANATTSKEKEEISVQDMKLPKKPDRAWYRENMKEICRKLKSVTRAHIALISLPPMGEDRNDAAYRLAAEYSVIIKEVAREEKVGYLPLNESMNEFLKGRKLPLPHDFKETETLMYKAIVQHYLLRQSYDEISTSNGFMVLSDFLHLNCTGAGMVADLVENFVIQDKGI
jgi:lysophospholipase L1-like esterase